MIVLRDPSRIDRLFIDQVGWVSDFVRVSYETWNECESLILHRADGTWMNVSVDRIISADHS
jgi:hypothetical protein